MKYYAVRKGRTCGIFTDWDRCKESVQGFPCAEYKSFKNREDAESFLKSGTDVSLPDLNSVDVETSENSMAEERSETVTEEVPRYAPDDKSEADRLTALCGTEAVAYVDGSFTKQGSFSCGVVLFTRGEKKIFAAVYEDAQYAAMRNVAGEIKGAEETMRYCVENGIRSLTIFHDYQGIAAWCTRAWEAKKPETRAYREYYDEITKDCQVTFRKVKGHSGDRYNEEADRLAGSADLTRDEAEWV